jgi:hypothetical protein
VGYILSNVYQKLIKLQSELKAPKNQYNNFGKYAYRSCEDIIEAVKPFLKKYGLCINISDEVSLIGERYYVNAMVTLTDIEDGKQIVTTASAREALTKKGMDESQITGAASSYARKYALNGMFAIDDTKDADVTNKHGKEEKTPENKKPDKTPELVSREERDEIFRIAKQVNLPNERLREIVKGFGYNDTTKIKKSDYSNILTKIANINK